MAAFSKETTQRYIESIILFWDLIFKHENNHKDNIFVKFGIYIGAQDNVRYANKYREITRSNPMKFKFLPQKQKILKLVHFILKNSSIEDLGKMKKSISDRLSEIQQQHLKILKAQILKKKYMDVQLILQKKIKIYKKIIQILIKHLDQNLKEISKISSMFLKKKQSTLKIQFEKYEFEQKINLLQQIEKEIIKTQKKNMEVQFSNYQHQQNEEIPINLYKKKLQQRKGQWIKQQKDNKKQQKDNNSTGINTNENANQQYAAQNGPNKQTQKQQSNQNDLISPIQFSNNNISQNQNGNPMMNVNYQINTGKNNDRLQMIMLNDSHQIIQDLFDKLK